MKKIKKIWVYKTPSFREAEKFDKNYYSNLTNSKRLEIVQFLREQYFKIKGHSIYEGRKRLRRSIKIIQQK